MPHPLLWPHLRCRKGAGSVGVAGALTPSALQVFHVAYVLIKFANSPRPDLWVLERSMDFGRTYQAWQFFASSKRDCLERFGPQTLERITRDDMAICTTEYSRIVPLENGEIVVSLVNGRPGAMNFSYSPLLRNFTKATNIRLRFLRTNTLLGHLMGKALRDPTVTRRVSHPMAQAGRGCWLGGPGTSGG
ncbi:Laminin subunit alpha-5 [Saguinus oedipus]|uniref:Laminin subunit alpha-5 n=1 Tax=Saguinus oedipus TaxID=9490 RepID=A0ABQ9VMD0_SAGOE|nr:Laminin subunit alpha-5 [Saguinus oedipus]